MDMKSKTKQLKEQLLKLSSIEERLDLLKNKYDGDTVYIVTCGPSLSTHDEAELKNKLKDKLVFSIKQAYNVVKEETDFHLINTYNLSDYEWSSESIVYWSLSKSYANEQLQRIIQMNAPLDLIIPITNPPFINREQTIQATNNFDEFYKMGTNTEVTWGIGMMYEMAIPLALLLGCKKLVVIGWDLGDPSKSYSPEQWPHFFKDKRTKLTGPMEGEIAELIRSTDKLYDWFQTKGVELEILSDTSFVSDKYKRVKLSDI